MLHQQPLHGVRPLLFPGQDLKGRPAFLPGCVVIGNDSLMRVTLEAVGNLSDFFIGQRPAFLLNRVAQPPREEIDGLIDDGLNFPAPRPDCGFSSSAMFSVPKFFIESSQEKFPD